MSPTGRLSSIPSPGRFCGIPKSRRWPVIERLRARYPHVRWVKEASGSVDRVDQMKQALGADITILSGDDSMTLPFMAVGAEGVISVASNLIARDVCRMVRCAQQNDLSPARAGCTASIYPLFKALFTDPNPVPIKTALARAGLIASAEVRAPCAK